MKGTKKSRVYILDSEVIIGEAGVTLKHAEDKTKLWHLSLEHISEKGLKELEKQVPLVMIRYCVLGKSTRTNFKRSSQKSNEKPGYVHSNLWRLAQDLSLSDNRYFLSIIDVLSKKVWMYDFKSKDQVFEKFKEWKQLVKIQAEKRLKKLRTNGGLEFHNQVLDSFYANESITIHKTVSLTPQQNVLAERMSRTLMNKVKCMLI